MTTTFFSRVVQLIILIYQVLGPRSLALNASLRLASYSRVLDVSSGIQLFCSLHLDYEQTRTSLVQLLHKMPSARRDYSQAPFTKWRAVRTIQYFLPYPQLHPLVMPFEVAATDAALYAAISPHLRTYRPHRLTLPPSRQQRQPLLIVPKQLQGLLVHTPQVHLQLTSRKLSQMALRLDGPSKRALEEVFLSSPPPSGQWRGLTKELISWLFDGQFGPRPALPDLSRIEGALKACITGYISETVDWLPCYRLFLQTLTKDYKGGTTRNGTDNGGDRDTDDDWQRALWEGKLLICALATQRVGQAQRVSLVSEYLQGHALEAIPLQVLAWIRELMGKHAIWLDGQQSKGLEDKLELMETLPGGWYPLWGDFDRLLDGWWELLRIQHPIMPLDLPVEKHSVSTGRPIIKLHRLQRWWADDTKPLKDSLLIDVNSFGEGVVIDMEGHDDGALVECSSFVELLEVLTKTLEEELKGHKDTDGQDLLNADHHPAPRNRLSQTSLWLAIYRTAASNLLYRHMVTFVQTVPWLRLLSIITEVFPASSSPHHHIVRQLQLLGLDYSSNTVQPWEGRVLAESSWRRLPVATFNVLSLVIRLILFLLGILWLLGLWAANG